MVHSSKQSFSPGERISVGLRSVEIIRELYLGVAGGVSLWERGEEQEPKGVGLGLSLKVAAYRQQEDLLPDGARDRIICSIFRSIAFTVSFALVYFISVLCNFRSLWMRHVKHKQINNK